MDSRRRQAVSVPEARPEVMEREQWAKDQASAGPAAPAALAKDPCALGKPKDRRPPDSCPDRLSKAELITEALRSGARPQQAWELPEI